MRRSKNKHEKIASFTVTLRCQFFFLFIAFKHLQSNRQILEVYVESIWKHITYKWRCSWQMDIYHHHRQLQQSTIYSDVNNLQLHAMKQNIHSREFFKRVLIKFCYWFFLCQSRILFTFFIGCLYTTNVGTRIRETEKLKGNLNSRALNDRGQWWK